MAKKSILRKKKRKKRKNIKKKKERKEKYNFFLDNERGSLH